MWSTVILSTGLVLLLGCAVAGTFLLQRQLHHGITSFGVLATSDSLLNTLIGFALVGLSLLKESSSKSKLCSSSIMLADTSTFLLSFVNSFISTLLMAIECWINAKIPIENEETDRTRHKSNRKRRLTGELLAQWILPVLSIVILHQLTPNNTMTSLAKFKNSNKTCELMNIFPIQMTSECQDGPMDVVENQQTSNMTLSVVQRIYELINGSVTNQADTVKNRPLTQPQTREEWKNMFLQFQMEPDHERKGKESLDLNVCDETCVLSFKRAEAYFIGLILLIYLIPMLGTVVLHHSTKVVNLNRQVRYVKESQEPNVGKLVKDNICHLEEVKMMILSNFIMWTPTIIERLVKKWLCNNTPQWLVAILFIISQMNTVVRGLINTNIRSTSKPLNKNVIVPLDSNSEVGIHELPALSIDKTEVLFQKRATIPEYINQ